LHVAAAVREQLLQLCCGFFLRGRQDVRVGVEGQADLRVAEAFLVPVDLGDLRK